MKSDKVINNINDGLTFKIVIFTCILKILKKISSKSTIFEYFKIEIDEYVLKRSYIFTFYREQA